jgi:hypothetical protein
MLGTTGCSLITGKGTIQTADGDILSQPLTETIRFLDYVKHIYTTIGITAGNAYDTDLMSEDDYDKLVKHANEFKIEYDKVVTKVMGWYDIEDSITKLSNKETIISAIQALNVNLTGFANLLEDTGVKPEDVRTIKALLSILNTMYVGGVK